MAYLETSFALWIFSFLQIAGLFSAWMARLSEGSPNQASCYLLFFVSFGLIGLTALATAALAPGYWLLSAATMCVMVLAAVWDVRSPARADRL